MLLRSELVLALVLAPGCSLVFPLGGSTQPADTVTDTSPPAVCPGLGDTPTFGSPMLHVIDARLCAQFTTSTVAGLGIGPCEATGGQLVLFEGPLDGPLHPSTITTQHSMLHSAVINPEGTRLITLESEGAGGFVIETYERVNSEWSHLAESPTMLVSPGILGAPSAEPDARIALFDSGSAQVVELRQTGSTWIAERMYDSPFGELQPVVNSSGLHLTPNGLAMLFTSNTPDAPGARQLGYADRASLAEPFGSARGIVLAASKLYGDASLGNDCTRVYITDFAGLSYVTQD